MTIGVLPQNPGDYKTDEMWIAQLRDEMTNLDIEWGVIDSFFAFEKFL